MRVGIFNQQTFRDGRRIEGGVSGNQCERLAQGETTPMDLERGRQLDGIVSPKKVVLRQAHRLPYEGRRDADDLKAVLEIGAETGQRRGGMSRR